jgi:hypothetical protein
MTTKRERACIACGKVYSSRYRHCSTCLRRAERAKYVGIRGCRICGGKVSVQGKVCKTCHSAALRKAREALMEKNPYRHQAYMDGVGRENARYMSVGAL